VFNPCSIRGSLPGEGASPFANSAFVLKLGDTIIDDTFAEAFGMRYVRFLITAHDEYWLEAAVREATGYSASVIACDSETGLDRRLAASETPDGRPGAEVMAFGFSTDALAQTIPNRVGQCVMTCPTTAVYDGMPDAPERIPLGKHIRFFGDGYQKSRVLAGRRYWRVPVMDGEFLVEERLGVRKGVAGGNVLIQAATQEAALGAARRGVAAVAETPGAITPFPGGVARSGSKVGSRYKKLKASTADAFCPTLRGRVESKLYPGVNCVLEIVIDGTDEATVARAMTAALRASAGDGIIALGAGNYGGKLGKFHFPLRSLLEGSE
jgi:formylmethanofuran--tetrahydromethanopterin N-formyltransferase